MINEALNMKAYNSRHHQYIYAHTAVHE